MVETNAAFSKPSTVSRYVPPAVSRLLMPNDTPISSLLDERVGQTGFSSISPLKGDTSLVIEEAKNEKEEEPEEEYEEEWEEEEEEEEPEKVAEVPQPQNHSPSRPPRHPPPLPQEPTGGKGASSSSSPVEVEAAVRKEDSIHPVSPQLRTLASRGIDIPFQDLQAQHSTHGSLESMGQDVPNSVFERKLSVSVEREVPTEAPVSPPNGSNAEEAIHPASPQLRTLASRGIDPPLQDVHAQQSAYGSLESVEREVPTEVPVRPPNGSNAEDPHQSGSFPWDHLETYEPEDGVLHPDDGTPQAKAAVTSSKKTLSSSSSSSFTAAPIVGETSFLHESEEKRAAEPPPPQATTTTTPSFRRPSITELEESEKLFRLWIVEHAEDCFVEQLQEWQALHQTAAPSTPKAKTESPTASPHATIAAERKQLEVLQAGITRDAEVLRTQDNRLREEAHRQAEAGDIIRRQQDWMAEQERRLDAKKAALEGREKDLVTREAALKEKEKEATQASRVGSSTKDSTASRKAASDAVEEEEETETTERESPPPIVPGMVVSRTSGAGPPPHPAPPPPPQKKTTTKAEEEQRRKKPSSASHHSGKRAASGGSRRKQRPKEEGGRGGPHSRWYPFQTARLFHGRWFCGDPICPLCSLELSRRHSAHEEEEEDVERSGSDDVRRSSSDLQRDEQRLRQEHDSARMRMEEENEKRRHSSGGGGGGGPSHSLCHHGSSSTSRPPPPHRGSGSGGPHASPPAHAHTHRHSHPTEHSSSSDDHTKKEEEEEKK